MQRMHDEPLPACAKSASHAPFGEYLEFSRYEKAQCFPDSRCIQREPKIYRISVDDVCFLKVLCISIATSITNSPAGRWWQISGLPSVAVMDRPPLVVPPPQSLHKPDLSSSTVLQGRVEIYQLNSRPSSLPYASALMGCQCSDAMAQPHQRLWPMHLLPNVTAMCLAFQEYTLSDLFRQPCYQHFVFANIFLYLETASTCQESVSSTSLLPCR
jgi:hypothetical protein